jgi:MFS family permease
MTIQIAPSPDVSRRRLGRLGVVVLLAGPFLANLDFFITNVALPTIQRDLHASAGALELIVGGYGTAYAVMLVAGGRLGDDLGRRRIFAIGVTAFTLTSLAAGLAPDVPILLLARVLQGASAALMTPQTLATFHSTLDGRAQHQAISLYAVAGGLAGILGQLIGGALIDADIAGSGWRLIFLINIPVGVAALLVLHRAVPPTRAPRAVGVDLPGTALVGLTIAALLIPLAEGPTLGWPWWTWITLATAPVLAVACMLTLRRTERKGRVPLLPPSILAVRSMRRGLPVLVGFFAVFGVFMFVYAIAVQDGLHHTALTTGLAIMPVGVAYFTASFAVPALLRRLDRNVLTIGLAIEAAGLLVVLVVVATSWPSIRPAIAIVGLVLAGIGQALCVGSLFRLVLSEVPSHAAGVGSGVLVTAQQTAMSIGVAGLGSLFTGIAAHGSMLHGVVVILAVQAGITLALVAASRLVPRVTR